MDDDTPYQIEIARVSGRAAISDARLAEAVCAALQRRQVARAQISVALVDDATIAELNQTHLQHEGPTDVLAFDLRGPDEAPLEGEVVLSVETARREARRRGHSEEAELMLYVVHGALHLTGMDDHAPEDAQRMHHLENEVLTALGVGPVFQADQA